MTLWLNFRLKQLIVAVLALSRHILGTENLLVLFLCKWWLDLILAGLSLNLKWGILLIQIQTLDNLFSIKVQTHTFELS